MPWGRMIGDDCGLVGAKACSTSTAHGSCWSLVSQAEIYSQSLATHREGFGSATTTRAFSVRRERGLFSEFYGPDPDTPMLRPSLCCPISRRAACGSDLKTVESPTSGTANCALPTTRLTGWAMAQ